MVWTVFIQRRCFSRDAGPYIEVRYGVGRFQTAKVFLLTMTLLRSSTARCWSLSNSEGVSPYMAFAACSLARGVGRFQTAKVFLPWMVSQTKLHQWVLVAFKQRRCFSWHGCTKFGPGWVLVAFKQRRCFSPPPTPATQPPGCWSLSNSEGVSPHN